MATFTATLQMSYGETTPVGSNIPARQTVSYTLTYTQESVKTVLIAANTTDFAIDVDTLTAPKVLFVQSLDVDVTVKLSDGVVVTPTPTALAGGSGWIMLANPNGQAIKSVLVTTPVSPTTGAHIQLLAFS